MFTKVLHRIGIGYVEYGELLGIIEGFVLDSSLSAQLINKAILFWLSVVSLKIEMIFQSLEP